MGTWAKRDEAGARAAAGDVVGRAAAWLDVPEVEVFARAHVWWFGRRASGEALERAFVAYMFGGRVPPWVRHYAREVLCGRALEAAPVGLDGQRPPAPPRHGRAVVGLTAALFAVLYIMLLGTTYDPQTSAPRSAHALACAPGGPGLDWFMRVGHAIAGREPPAC